MSSDRKMGTNRRARGEGTLKWRADRQQYEIQVSLGTRPDGRRDRRSVYGDNPQDVARNARKLREDHDRGELADTGHRYETLRDLYGRLETHLNTELVKGRISTDTRDYYLRQIRNHVLDTHSGTRAVDVTTDMIDLWVTRKSELVVVGGLKSASCYAIYISVRKMLDVARRARVIPRNPALETTAPTVRNASPNPVGDHEVELLVKASQTTPALRTDMTTALWILSYTGMRRVEILGLQWCDIDLTADTITIRVTKQRRTAQPRVRVFPIVGTLKDYLTGLGEHDAAEYVVANVLDPSRPRERASFSRSLEIVGRRAGVEISAHQFRHAAATQMLANQVPPKDICELMGWSNLNMLNRYAHSTVSGSRSGAQALDRLPKP